VRRFSLVQRVGLFAACVAALVGVLFVAALFAILSLRQAESRESRSKDVTVAALRVRSRTADLESALRGYVLSANPRFVEIFRQNKAGVPGDLANLLKLVQNDPSRHALASSVASELHNYLIDYADNVLFLASVSRGAAAGPASGSEAKRRIGQINGTLDELLAAEDERAQQASAHARNVIDFAASIRAAAFAVRRRSIGSIPSRTRRRRR